MCRRRESDLVHSASREIASSRESCSCMAVNLAHRFGPAAPQAARGAASLGAPRLPIQAAGPLPMEKFVIEGGVPLSGMMTPAGNKNGALPILAACLLTEDEVILRNVPRINDVEAMVALVEGLGARVQWLGPGELSIDAGSVDHCEVDRGM